MAKSTGQNLLETPSEVTRGRRCVFAGCKASGFSIERFELAAQRTLHWHRPPEPDAVQIWLNVDGSTRIEFPRSASSLKSATSILFHSGVQESVVQMDADGKRVFLIFVLNGDFLRSCLPTKSGNLHPVIGAFLRKSRNKATVGPSRVLTTSLRDFASTLARPPVLAAAQSLWYRAKVMELIADFCFEVPDEELFCSRQRRVNAERAEAVKRILRSNVAEPPDLKAVACEVGCSPYHLSRIFSAETGVTISQYLQGLRIDLAAELLRSGECNVTEAAFKVGYNSPSHFSQTFCKKMGVCPAMYSFLRKRDPD